MRGQFYKFVNLEVRVRESRLIRAVKQWHLKLWEWMGLCRNRRQRIESWCLKNMCIQGWDRTTLEAEERPGSKKKNILVSPKQYRRKFLSSAARKKVSKKDNFQVPFWRGHLWECSSLKRERPCWGLERLRNSD